MPYFIQVQYQSHRSCDRMNRAQNNKAGSCLHGFADRETSRPTAQTARASAEQVVLVSDRPSWLWTSRWAVGRAVGPSDKLLGCRTSRWAVGRAVGLSDKLLGCRTSRWAVGRVVGAVGQRKDKWRRANRRRRCSGDQPPVSLVSIGIVAARLIRTSVMRASRVTTCPASAAICSSSQ